MIPPPAPLDFHHFLTIEMPVTKRVTKRKSAISSTRFLRCRVPHGRETKIDASDKRLLAWLAELPPRHELVSC